MNHYLLYTMIYGRILEATCAILSMVALVGTGAFRGTGNAWVFWVMAVLFAGLRVFVTWKMKDLESDCETTVFQDLHLDK